MGCHPDNERLSTTHVEVFVPCADCSAPLQAKCTLFHPPGYEIYRRDSISFFEIDGRKNKVCTV